MGLRPTHPLGCLVLFAWMQGCVPPWLWTSPHVPRVKGVDADNTHLKITSGDLPACRPHVVRREDQPGNRNVHTTGQDHRVTHIGHVREGARGHCLARTDKVTVMQRSAGVIDEPDLVHSDWHTIWVEHKQTVGSTLLLLTLDDPVALDRPARHPGVRALFSTKLGDCHGLTTEARWDVCLSELPWRAQETQGLPTRRRGALGNLTIRLLGPADVRVHCLVITHPKIFLGRDTLYFTSWPS